MDKIRVASLAGMKKYLARRQIDARIILLADMNNSAIDRSRYNCLDASSLTYEINAPPIFGNSALYNAAKASGTSASYSPPTTDSNTWTIDIAVRQSMKSDATNNVIFSCGLYTFSQIWNNHLKIYNGSTCLMSYISYNQNGWKYYRITSEASGVRIYYNGILSSTYATPITLPFSRGINLLGETQIGAVRVINGVACTTSLVMPTQYFTGYEPLGA